MISKSDLLDDAEREALVERFVLAWPGRPVLAVSALTGAGLTDLTGRLMDEIREVRRALVEDPDFAATQAALEAAISADVLASSMARSLERSLARRRLAGESTGDLEEDEEAMSPPDDDDGDIEVVYVRD